MDGYGAVSPGLRQSAISIEALLRPSMTHRTLTKLRLCLVLLAGSGVCAPALGQPPDNFPDFSRAPLITYDRLFADSPPPPGGCFGACRGARFPLFGMPVGFLYEPVGLENDDDPPPEDPLAPAGSPTDTLADLRVQVALGSHNPFFDLRKAGDPGGVGYYKLHSQVQLLDGESAALSLGLQAVTPAGLDSNGVQDGPTVVSPSLAWSQDLGGDTALHGFIGKDVRGGPRWADRLERGIRCGLAVQSPLPYGGMGLSPNLHMFVEALGRLNHAGSLTDPAPRTFEVLPGLHWRLNDSCWMSGAVIVPVDAPRLELWQITCRWQF
jgi:hypothetical protein